jgi:hypothetical protein
MTLHPIPPLLLSYEENFIFFFISVPYALCTPSMQNASVDAKGAIIRLRNYKFSFTLLNIYFANLNFFQS